jgi:hypothetical protein
MQWLVTESRMNNTSAKADHKAKSRIVLEAHIVEAVK